jgi:hypothetical protein
MLMRRASPRVLLAALAAAALTAGCGHGDEFAPVVCTDTGGRPVTVAGEWVIEGDGERTTCGDPDLNQSFHLGPAHFRVRETDPNPPAQHDAGLDAPPPDAGVPDGRPDGVAAGDGGGGDAVAGGDGNAGEAGAGDAGTGEAGAGDDAGTGDAGTSDDAGAGDGGAGDALVTDAPAAGDGPADAGLPDGGADATAAPDAAVTYSSATLSLESPIPGFELAGTVAGSCVSFQTTERLSDGRTVTYAFTGEYQSSWPHGITGSFTGTGPGPCVTRGKFTVELQ